MGSSSSSAPGLLLPRKSALQIYPYQQKWFLDRSRFKLGKFARQTGKTFTTTLEIVDDVYMAEAEARKSPWIILSRGERQAVEAMEEGVVRHASAYGIASKSLAREDIEFYDEDNIKRRGLELIFPGGTKVGALPANPDTARGFSRNVYLDEFAFHKDTHVRETDAIRNRYRDAIKLLESIADGDVALGADLQPATGNSTPPGGATAVLSGDRLFGDDVLSQLL